MDYTQWAKDTFINDIYASKTTGIEIVSADVNSAKCRLEVTHAHLNATGHVMGGAIYTLADFTFAIAANVGNPMTVSLCSNINYVNGAKSNLNSFAKCIKDGKRTCVFEIEITDDSNKLIATAVITGMRT